MSSANALLKRVVGHAGVQAISQVLGFVSGVIVVRELGKNDYAHYSICVSVLAALTFLSDSGTTAVLLSRGAQLLRKPRELAQHFANGLHFRRRLGAGLVLLGAIWIVVLLSRNGMSLGGAAWLTAVALLTLGPVLTIGIYQTAARLMLDIRTIQLALLSGNVARLLLLVVLLAVDWMSPTSVLLVGLMIPLGMLMVLKSRAQIAIPRPSGRLDTTQARLFGDSLKRVLPMTVLLVCTEQLVLGLVTYSANPAVVAEMAALSRFAVAFVVINALATDIAAPIVARTTGGRSRIVGRYLVVVALYSGVVAAMVAAVAVFAKPLIAILGASYQGLEIELVLFAAGYAIASLGHAMESLNSARGWLSWSWSYGPFAAGWLVLSLVLLDLSTIRGAALLFVGQTVPSVLTQFVRFAKGAWSEPRA